eukprot:364389-Chlamydomonas_euryale.AAC.7
MDSLVCDVLLENGHRRGHSCVAAAPPTASREPPGACGRGEDPVPAAAVMCAPSETQAALQVAVLRD